MKIFKCEAQGDTLYFKAETLDAARLRLIDTIGEDIPEKLLIWTEVSETPEGEETL